MRKGVIESRGIVGSVKRRPRRIARIESRGWKLVPRVVRVHTRVLQGLSKLGVRVPSVLSSNRKKTGYVLPFARDQPRPHPPQADLRKNPTERLHAVVPMQYHFPSGAHCQTQGDVGAVVEQSAVDEVPNTDSNLQFAQTPWVSTKV